MDVNANLGIFLLSVVLVSLSGVMMPGPVTAVTVAEGHKKPNAGAFIALGHGIIEFPVMAAIYIGMGSSLISPTVKMTMGVVGGLILLYMGFQMLRVAGKVLEEAKGFPYGSLVAGMVTTGANPYFFLWWVTIGATLITDARAFGLGGIMAFAFSHWLCDLSWNLLISRTVFKFKRLWDLRAQRFIYSGCALVLLGFGGWFTASALSKM